VRDALPEARGPAVLKVIGIGNAWRGDDAAGLAVAERLSGRLPDGVELLQREGEPTGLLDAWAGSDAIWLVDAVRSGAPPGRVYRLDAGDSALPAELFRGSTHHLGVPDAVELARALGQLPRTLVVFGIEGESFAAGHGLSPAVASAVERVAEHVREEVEECTRRR
jgi:hydrogenase maturation protease